MYDKLGGEPAIQAVVDKMYVGIFSDERLTPYFTKTDKERQKRMQKEFLTYLTGGSKEYHGKSMKEAHKGRGIEEEHFNIVAGYVKGAMDDLKVPDDLQTQVMNALSALKDDCIGS